MRCLLFGRGLVDPVDRVVVGTGQSKYIELRHLCFMPLICCFELRHQRPSNMSCLLMLTLLELTKHRACMHRFVRLLRASCRGQSFGRNNGERRWRIVLVALSASRPGQVRVCGGGDRAVEIGTEI